VIRARLLALAILAAFALPAIAGVAPAVASEIDRLLDRLAGSQCEFYRNGTWYGAEAARRHLEKKYRYLADHGSIPSSEDFIRRAATASSASGEAYRVRCQGRELPSAAWLTRELERVRSR
jgi:hypothetical protein